MKILLKEIMEKKGLTLRQVVIMSGVPKTTLLRIINGQIPKLDTLEQIAKGLKLRINDLFESDYK